jgi:SAM-dependent methyltransferase
VSTQLFDPAQYKAGQRREWSTAAPAWKNWWQRIEPALQPISDRMMDLVGIRPGQQVLDVATGIGAPAVTAARRVGPTGGVIATDIAPQMLDIGRKRVLELGLDNIDFREMDAEALELPESSFDAILCRFGLMFLPNLQTALGQMRKLLVPGGQLTAAVWGPPQKVPFASIPLAVALRELRAPAPPPGLPGPFRLADVDALKQVLRQARFSHIYTEPMVLTFEWFSPDEFVSFHREVLTQLNALLARYPIERQAEVWQAIAEAAEQYRTPAGTLLMENEVILAVGRR